MTGIEVSDYPTHGTPPDACHGLGQPIASCVRARLHVFGWRAPRDLANGTHLACQFYSAVHSQRAFFSASSSEHAHSEVAHDRSLSEVQNVQVFSDLVGISHLIFFLDCEQDCQVHEIVTKGSIVSQDLS